MRDLRELLRVLLLQDELVVFAQQHREDAVSRAANGGHPRLVVHQGELPEALPLVKRVDGDQLSVAVLLDWYQNADLALEDDIVAIAIVPDPEYDGILVVVFDAQSRQAVLHGLAALLALQLHEELDLPEEVGGEPIRLRLSRLHYIMGCINKNYDF